MSSQREKMKNKKLLSPLKNQAGSAAIAFMIAASAGTFYLVNNMNDIVQMLSSYKKKQWKDYEINRFLEGAFNYTTFAIKERWCMDSSWAKTDCGSDMHDVVTNKLNLERLLWSQTANNAIKDLYKKKYSTDFPGSPALNEVNAVIDVSSLSSLGLSHPINLSLSAKVRNCFNQIHVSIKKSADPKNQPKGDEKLLEVMIKGIKKDISQCDDIPGNPYITSVVGYYPRTLNQFAFIKAGDFNASKYTGDKKKVGIRFFNPVYIERDLIVPESGYSPVGFFDVVRIGGGNLRRGGELFNPSSYGGDDSSTYAKLKTMTGIKAGVSFETEVDPGISPLFGTTFDYPDNTILDKCIARSKIKDNPYLTKNSRLFMKGSDGKYSLALSSENEFRPYSYPWHDTKPDEYMTWYGEKSRSRVNYVQKEEDTRPILKLSASENGATFDSAQTNLLLGRNTKANIDLVSSEFLETSLTQITASEIDVKSEVYKTFESQYGLESKVEEYKSDCTNLKKKYSKVTVPGCEKFYPEMSDRTGSCDDYKFFKKSWCKKRVEDAEKSVESFEENRALAQADIEAVKAAPPVVEVESETSYANRVNLDFNVINPETLDNPMFKDYGQVTFTVDAFDFAIEGSGNPETGKRSQYNHLPGPNDPGNPNIINVNFIKDGSGKFSKVTYTNADGSQFSSMSWKGLKQSDSYDPPWKWDEGLKKYILPDDALTVAEVAKLDEECSEVSDVNSFDWDLSFTDNTQFSWLYNVAHSGVTIEDPSSVKPISVPKVLKESEMAPGSYQGIPTLSIAKECIIDSSSNFIFGFYVCEKLTISSRSAKLDIVGTIISEQLEVHSSALDNGVNFYSIWHPNAISLLRSKGHLANSAGGACNFTEPGWSPFLNETQENNFLSCSPMKFVIHGANNFNWTTVDPDIGISTAGSNVSTQSKIPGRYRRFQSSVLWTELGIDI